MRRSHVLGTIAVLFLVAATAATTPSEIAFAGPGAAPAAVSSGPWLRFEANQGQFDDDVRFLARSEGRALFFTPAQVVLQTRDKHVIRMQFVGSLPGMQVVGQEKLRARTHYYIGNDPARWNTDVPSYSSIAYKNVYAGIDVIFRANDDQQLQYDIVLQPGALTEVIRLQFTGATALSIDTGGDLLVDTPSGRHTHHAPVVYQDDAGVRRQIPGRFVLLDDFIVGFQVDGRDPGLPLVIDPVLGYSSFLGGNNNEELLELALDDAGVVHMAGWTASVDFPRETPGEPGPSGRAIAYVTKIDPSLSGAAQLIYTTFIGGSGPGSESADALKLDAQGNAYITGDVHSPDFPTLAVGGAPFDASLDGAVDAFVAKLDVNGTLVYSSFLGGTGDDVACCIDLDPSGRVYITGRTDSPGFPVRAPAGSPYDSTLNGQDVYLAQMDLAGAGDGDLLYATFLGGSGAEVGAPHGLAVDEDGIAYWIGRTPSVDFPTTDGCPHAGGGFDRFVAMLDPAGLGAADLLFSSFLGGSDNEETGGDVAIRLEKDAGGAILEQAIYVIGRTLSDDFPTTAGAFDESFNPPKKRNAIATDGVLTIIDPRLATTGCQTPDSDIVYSTYLGGNDDDHLQAVAVDESGAAYLTGRSASKDFPTTPDAFPDGPSSNVVLAKLNPAGAGAADLLFSTFLGEGIGEGGSISANISILPPASVYVAGTTNSSNYPVTADAFDSTFNGFQDVYFSRIDFEVGCATNAECDDGSECTVDTCVAGTCNHAPVADDTACAGGLCCSGSCQPASCTVDPDCDDADICTDDACLNAGTCAASCDNAFDSTNDPSCDICVPTHSKEKGPRCSDGLDNDCDGLIDGADPDC